MSRNFTWGQEAMWWLIELVAGLLPVVLGLVVLGSPEGTWSAVSWQTLMSWASHEAWGAALVGFGALTLYHRFWWQVAFVGYVGCAAWFWLWAASFLVNTLNHPNTALTGIPMYGAAALIFTGFAVATCMDRESNDG
jgi:hypothetical protein